MTVLHDLLDDSQTLAPEYNGGMTTHLPMALHALQGLGASGERLRAFAARHADHPRDAPAEFLALRAHHLAALERDGEDAALRNALPALLQGVAAGAFHGLIRTAHAVEAGHRAELASGLAYWSWRWQPMDPPDTSAPPLAFGDWADGLVQATSVPHGHGWMISARLRQAQSAPAYRAFAGRLAPAPDTVKRLAGLAVDRYLATRHFTVLHLVTGLRAVRVLWPWVDDARAAAAALIPAFTAACIAAGKAPAAPRRSAGMSTWSAVIAAAVASDDDHVIKLVEACRAEAAVYGEGRYLEAAALAVA